MIHNHRHIISNAGCYIDCFIFKFGYFATRIACNNITAGLFSVDKHRDLTPCHTIGSKRNIDSSTAISHTTHGKLVFHLSTQRVIVAIDKHTAILGMALLVIVNYRIIGIFRNDRRRHLFYFFLRERHRSFALGQEITSIVGIYILFVYKTPIGVAPFHHAIGIKQNITILAPQRHFLQVIRQRSNPRFRQDVTTIAKQTYFLRILETHVP